MADHVGWPGFRPREIPLTVYDGEKTYLFRHPEPPEEFRPVSRGGPVWATDGRYPALRANTAIDVGGVPTAGVLARTGDSGGANGLRAPEEIARLLIHEAFHVYQAERHPDWTANEVDLFTYPVADVELLRLRRLETAALRRAVHPADSTRELCWGRAVVRWRERRLERLPDEAAAYERGTELREGLARYVERRAAGQTGPPSLPAEGFPPEAVRERAYATGHAFAYLLDRIGAHWREELEASQETGGVAEPDKEPTPGRTPGPEPRPGPGPGLADLLRSALRPVEGPRCRLTPDEAGRARAVAAADVGALRRGRVRRREAFERRPGWSVAVIAAAGRPLFPQEFDPLNVEILGEGGVLHTRLLRLGGADGSLEILDAEALTEAAGSHPLFEGVARVLLTGMAEEPGEETRGDTLIVESPGFTGRFLGASLRREGRRWIIGWEAPERTGG